MVFSFSGDWAGRASLRPGGAVLFKHTRPAQDSPSLFHFAVRQGWL